MTATTAPAGADRPLLAIVFRLGAALAQGCLFTMVKLAGEHGIALAQVMFWRFVLSVPVLLAYLTATGQLPLLRTRRPGAHLARGAASSSGMVLNFGATMVLPLAMITTLNFTTPLFAVLIAALILHQTVSGWNWLAVLMGFVGVVLVAQPSPGEAVSHLGAGAALVAAGLVAITNMQVRDLARTEAALTIVFYFSLFGAVVAACSLPFFPAPDQPGQWLLLAGIGVAGLAFQLLMALSLRFGTVSTVLVMDYSVLIWATLAGWLVWDHLPPVTTWLGAPLIVGAGLMIAWRAHRGQRTSAAAAEAPAPA